MSRTELGMITGIILNNTDHLWMKQGDFESATVAANDLLGVTFNPRSIKEVYQRTVRLGDQDFVETKLNYFTPQEQHALFVKWLMKLEVGEAFAKVGSTVRKIRIVSVESRVSNEEVEQWRINQPWLIGVKEEISITFDPKKHKLTTLCDTINTAVAKDDKVRIYIVTGINPEEIIIGEGAGFAQLSEMDSGSEKITPFTQEMLAKYWEQQNSN